MKYLLVLLVVVIGLWMLFGRGRRGDGAGRRRGAGGPAVMVSCAHCGVHLPREDAVFDAAKSPYCSEAHRLAGPKSGP